jgi:hypothetical protein
MRKVYQSGDYEAVHKVPVWQDKANFIIATYLGDKNERAEWEQLWVKKLGERRFLICCIPFFAYDLALGDEVETDEKYVIQKVLIPSGHYTFRVWFGDILDLKVRDHIVQSIDNLKIPTEWSSENLLGVSAPNLDQAEVLANHLSDWHKTYALSYETGRTT